MTYKCCDDWLCESEGYSLRIERIPDGALPWIREAWRLGMKAEQERAALTAPKGEEQKWSLRQELEAEAERDRLRKCLTDIFELIQDMSKSAYIKLADIGIMSNHVLTSPQHTITARGSVVSLTENDLYYLRSILRQMQEVQTKLPHFTLLSIGGEVFADNLDWLDCFIDKHERAALKGEITTEALDALQFGRVVHKRPVKGEG